MTEIINLESLFLNNGNNKGDWEFFAADIKKEDYSEKIIESISLYLKKNDQDEVSLALDITDYILDFGSPKIISLIAQQNFLEDILNILKSETNANVENQKKVIYLIGKWAKKFQNSEELDGFQKNFIMLQSNGITFPDESFSMDTYNKYFGEGQHQNQNPQPQENNQANNIENQQPPQEEGFPPIQNAENNNQPPQGQQNNFNPVDNKDDLEGNPYEDNNNNNETINVRPISVVTIFQNFPK
jgi:hypothetical protein